MKHVLQRLVILFVIFIAAGSGYFYWMRVRATGKESVYISMEEPELPVVYLDILGREMDSLHGYVQEMNTSVLRDSLAFLPEDRALPIHIRRCQSQVVGIYYEIRSLDMTSLIERTRVDNWETVQDGVKAVLPVQNLLVKDQEYALILTIDTADHGAVRYYSRVVWGDNAPVKQMVDLAADFSAKTFSYDQATELVTYLESDATGDNTNLGSVDIHSSFSQITWAGLSMELAGEIQVTLKERRGSMTQVTTRYLAVCEGEGSRREMYEVEDNFTMRMGEQRIYMMDFERRTNQIFMGTPESFTGSRIMLGITNDDQVQARSSESGKVHAFVSNGDLWSYDEGGEELKAIRIFSFRSSSEEGASPSFREHSIKILRAMDTGDVDFLVYGYMNRGRHEGCVGVTLYHYNAEQDALEERFFIPAADGYEKLKLDVEELSYLSTGGTLYLKVNSGIYAVDLSSNESMVVAEGLPEGGYAISQNGQRLAWQEGSLLYQSHQIHLMNLETEEKTDVTSTSGDSLRLLGFVGNDFIYGLARENTQWMINGYLEELPMYAIEILDETMDVLTRYEKNGYFISGVSVGDSRIHLQRIVSVAGDTYRVVDEDTIVCNEEIADDKLAGIGWYADAKRQKLYFVQLGSEMERGHYVHRSAPEKITYGSSEILNLGTAITAPGIDFYAYGGGHLLGITQDFAKAVELAYEKMGIVTGSSQEVYWCRVDRPTTAAVENHIESISRFTNYMGEATGNRRFADGVLLFNARGCSLNQVLYFLGQGYPVRAYTEDGLSCYLVGYDQYNVTIYQPVSGESSKMGLNDANAYFEQLGNDFLCVIFPPK